MCALFSLTHDAKLFAKLNTQYTDHISLNLNCIMLQALIHFAFSELFGALAYSHLKSLAQFESFVSYLIVEQNEKLKNC